MKLADLLRNLLVSRLGALPTARHVLARLRGVRYRRHVQRFVREGTGRADRLPMGFVYEATMRFFRGTVAKR